VEGTPTILVLHGKAIQEHLRREAIDEDTLQASLREHGIGDITDVEMAVLEIDGSISVVPVGSSTRRLKRAGKILRPH
jgi:uncharacterized membrane protein YcaP (DUF421 family)